METAFSHLLLRSCPWRGDVGHGGGRFGPARIDSHQLIQPRGRPFALGVSPGHTTPGADADRRVRMGPQPGRCLSRGRARTTWIDSARSRAAARPVAPALPRPRWCPSRPCWRLPPPSRGAGGRPAAPKADQAPARGDNSAAFRLEWPPPARHTPATSKKQMPISLFLTRPSREPCYRDRLWHTPNWQQQSPYHRQQPTCTKSSWLHARRTFTTLPLSPFASVAQR